MQTDILAKNPSLPVRVYAVWFNMLYTDRRSVWPEEVITDSRVTHLWDEGKLLGRWYSPRISDGKHVVWDTFLLYPPGADLDAPPESLVAAGSTIMKEREELRRGIKSLPRRSM